MSHARERTTVTIHHLRPPYRCWGTPFADAPGARRELGPGSLLALHVDDPARGWPAVAERVPALRERYPMVPVLLRVGDAPAAALLEMARRAAHLRIRATVPADAPIAATLRPILTSPVDLPGEVLELLARLGVVLRARLHTTALQLLSGAEQHRCSDDLFRALHVSERTARNRLRKKRLPPPGAWLGMARALRTALELQAHPERPLLAVALARGYADHSGLCKHVRRVFDATARDIRRTLGWEWLVHRWVRLHVAGPGSGAVWAGGAAPVVKPAADPEPVGTS